MFAAAKTVPGVLGSFVHVDGAVDAIKGLRARGHRDLTVYTAAPNHEIEEALEHKISPVRLFTLVGGLTGCISGLAMTYWMSFDWPLLVGGKPIATVPPYVVIMFELTVLFGALFTVTGVGLLALRKPTTGIAYSERFTDDQIGIFVPCAPDRAADVEALLKQAGSVEVRRAA
jgi:molybdopterin-containing oxidoreductase family membrane subunit